MTHDNRQMTSPPPTIWSTCKEGFLRNRFPALILQSFAAMILVCYFFVPVFRPAFEAIGRFKAAGGFSFALFSTAFFGGLIPWAVMVHRGRIPRGMRGKHLLFYVGYWGIQGTIVDCLYTFQTQWFGSGNDFQTLASKILVDQVPFNLFWATPCGLLLFGWKNADFSWSKFRQEHTRPVMVHTYIAIQFSSWMVWVPAVIMIYSLPPDLQVPLFNLVLCFFSLILTFVSRKA